MPDRARVIAVDGPSASGKSTVARKVAAALNYLYVDSGALYRGITWNVLSQGGDPGKTGDVLDCLARMKIDIFVAEGAVRFRIGGVEPVAEIRSQRVCEGVSEVAALPEVRTAVTGWLRGMTQFGSLVMEGRDIGTVVFPAADAKFYIDASPEERARRRHAETQKDADLRSVMTSLENRDRKDIGRKSAPLKVAADAAVIDSTGLSVDEVVEKIVQSIKARNSVS